MQDDKFKLNSNQKAFRAYLLAGGATSVALLSNASPSHAQATAIDTATVSTQLTAAQTAMTGIGGVLLAMGMGILLFTIGKKIIKRVTSG